MPGDDELAVDEKGPARPMTVFAICITTDPGTVIAKAGKGFNKRS